ncbi:hypothetical protein BCR32DRAFT_274440 [Anaeromyces robustus]|uniref:Uncharacterized protein n=1 Tax=Anaeromyces robustus TaxID=1754192 RepID=A0A1Y1XNX4_9FUNG|nr:hypothetical protein BCR32DRAFT_274440 [Anaeromyces robustus]|eukprot:ORX87460.1 hypothetical protein BCR32DRAFT_274440 [Anaeromyces robustus]
MVVVGCHSFGPNTHGLHDQHDHHGRRFHSLSPSPHGPHGPHSRHDRHVIDIMDIMIKVNRDLNKIILQRITKRYNQSNNSSIRINK